jgi:hypothetical protein
MQSERMTVGNAEDATRCEINRGENKYQLGCWVFIPAERIL